jgi:hypothetical protein
MELYEDVLQNSLLSCILCFLAWLAAIIMIFVSCTNINEYLRNDQDCLTLAPSWTGRIFSLVFSFLVHQRKNDV